MEGGGGGGQGGGGGWGGGGAGGRGGGREGARAGGSLSDIKITMHCHCWCITVALREGRFAWRGKHGRTSKEMERVTAKPTCDFLCVVGMTKLLFRIYHRMSLL